MGAGWIVEPCATPYKLQLFIIVSKYIFNVSHRYGKYKKKILSAWAMQQSPGIVCIFASIEKLLRRIIVISYHNHFVPAISYNSENHFRTICRSIYYYHFVPYADRHIMTISYHMQIDTLWPFRTICRSIHYYNFVPYANHRHIMTIS